MSNTTAKARAGATKKQQQSSSRRNPPRSRRRTPARRSTRGRKRRQRRGGKSLDDRLREARRSKVTKKIKAAYERLRDGVLSLFTRKEVEQMARESGFYVREPKEIKAFEFALCCAMGSMVEHKRGFAAIWRVLTTLAGVEVARSAVTQRFTAGAAALLELIFTRALQRMPQAGPSIDRAKLNQFREVLAQDGTVLQLSPLLEALFPATRTNVVDAAAKAHVGADLMERRIVDVTVTGERGSEIDEVYLNMDFKEKGLYLFDLGYTSYDLLSIIDRSKAFVIMRLKDNANPKVVRVRHGIKRPRASEGLKLKEVETCKTAKSFALDAEFRCSEFAETVQMRVVGLWNPETQRFHRYVTNLPPDLFGVEELSTLYRQRWTIELLMKLLKSSCHLDHLDTANPDALRTLIYSSLLAALILQCLIVAAAKAEGVPVEQISYLTVGIIAPLLGPLLMFLWLGRELTLEDMAAMILRAILYCCRDQNPGRTRASTQALR
jgi:IS4 transposase